MRQNFRAIAKHYRSFVLQMKMKYINTSQDRLWVREKKLFVLRMYRFSRLEDDSLKVLKSFYAIGVTNPSCSSLGQK